MAVNKVMKVPVERETTLHEQMLFLRKDHVGMHRHKISNCPKMSWHEMNEALYIHYLALELLLWSFASFIFNS